MNETVFEMWIVSNTFQVFSHPRWTVEDPEHCLPQVWQWKSLRDDCTYARESSISVILMLHGRCPPNSAALWTALTIFVIHRWGEVQFAPLFFSGNRESLAEYLYIWISCKYAPNRCDMLVCPPLIIHSSTSGYLDAQKNTINIWLWQ